MKLKQFLTLNAIMFIPFGLGMLIVPYLIFPMIHVDLDSDGLLMANTVGSMLLSFGIICYLSRNEDKNAIGMKAILIGNLVFHVIDFLLTFKGVYTGVMNSLGYLFSTLHFLFAIGFLYYLTTNKKLEQQ
jgi:hypothetical protein